MEMIKQEIQKAESMLNEFEIHKVDGQAIRDVMYYIKGLKMAYKVLNKGEIYAY